MGIIREFTTFLKRPHYFEHKEKWSIQTIGSLFKLFGLKLVLTIIVYMTITYIFSLFFEQSEMPKRASSIRENMTLYRILSVIVLLPFIEEVLFRSWLRKKWALVYMPLILCAIVLVLIFELGNTTRNFVFLVALATVSISLLASQAEIPETGLVNRYVKRAFPVIFWGSAILFALMHISNFSTYNEVGAFVVFLTSTQLVGGLFYGFICMRFSFSAAFLSHSFWNGSLVLIAAVV